MKSMLLPMDSTCRDSDFNLQQRRAIIDRNHLLSNSNFCDQPGHIANCFKFVYPVTEAAPATLDPGAPVSCLSARIPVSCVNRFPTPRQASTLPSMGSAASETEEFWLYGYG